MQQKLEQLKNSSLHITEEVEIRWANQDKVGHLNPAKIAGNLIGEKVYAISGKVVAFFSEGEMYVTPKTKKALEALRSAGYKCREFFVPFANGKNVPTGAAAERWNTITAATAA
ncbi:PRC-barrel domain-containing protein [Candidatus Saccharibacteria bacterium]|nr:PRC-barrel domain-containing protein [Candidatus Saccharibacteria bacterium]